MRVDRGRLRRFLLVGLPWLAAAIVAACAPGPSVYAKPGITYAEWKRDDTDCRALAQRDSRRVDRSVYNRCMHQRGYAVPEER